MVSAVILAAGASSRFGPNNKLLLPWGSGSLITHVVKTAIASDAGECILVLGHEADRILSELGALSGNFQHVTNRQSTSGMTRSIQLGVAAASDTAGAFMILPADLPLVTAAELNALIAAHRQTAARREHPIVVPVFAGTRGNPVIFSAAYKAEILAHTSHSGCRGIVAAHASGIIEVVMDQDHVLQDIDTLADYQRLRKMAH